MNKKREEDMPGKSQREIDWDRLLVIPTFHTIL